MERLTDRKTAADLKRNCEGLQAAGIEPNISDLRYIKLAEYENVAEHIEITTAAPVLSYQVAMIKRLMDGKISEKPTKTIIDETSVYELDYEPKDETKWAKDNPSLTPFISQRFMKRR